MKLSELPNIGTVLESQLFAVGIDSSEMLRKMGTEEVFLKLKAYDPTSCFHKLTAIEGAVQGIPKKNISEQRKKELKEFFSNL